MAAITQTQINLKWEPGYEWKVEELDQDKPDSTWTIKLGKHFDYPVTMFLTRSQLEDLAATIVGAITGNAAKETLEAMQAGLRLLSDFGHLPNPKPLTVVDKS